MCLPDVVRLPTRVARKQMTWFAVAGATAWNSLSDDLRNPTLSTDSFRRLLKTHLFSAY